MPSLLKPLPFLEGSVSPVDVRSPSEFAHAHIPGAINFPLFSDEERIEVGTSYKVEGNEQALLLGLRCVGPKLEDFAQKALQIKDKEIYIHCWRGGMRSASMAWLFEMLGKRALLLEGGYKAFRQWVLKTFEKSCKVRVLGGLTGSGKTRILHALRDAGEQVLDLEDLANHRGSSFGYLGKQPSTEQFENEIAVRWNQFDPEKPVWIEDESRMVGACTVPAAIFEQMHKAPLLVMKIPIEERLEILKEDYAEVDSSYLIEATKRLEKKLGGLRTKEVISLIESGNYLEASRSVLDYYDRTYSFCLKKKIGDIITIEEKGLSSEEWAQKLCLKEAEKYKAGSKSL